ncbi:MAG: HipA domain-containing protein, partial [Trebonia sp.]
ARMAVLAGARPVDTYGILEAFGRDCAGAVMVLPDGEVPGESVASGYVPMVPADLSRLIGNLDVAPLGAAPERGFRPSLAGYQRKALVGRAADGTWQLPYGDAPSTWILKPDGPQPMAANEITCLRLAAACGFAVPENELLDVAGVPVLAVKRYDRLEPATAGDVPQRLHQEDGCQATACPPGQKYEEHGGPRLRDLAVLLRDVGDPRDVTELLCRTTFNMAVGNADAHAKNFSVLHSPDALEIRLSPVYDVLSTIALELKDASGRPMRADTHMGQRVGGHADVRQVTGADIIDEAVAWGIGKRSASRVVTGTLDRVRGAIGTAQGDERVIDAIRQRTGRLLNTVTDP